MTSAPSAASAVHDVVLLGSAIAGAAGGTQPQRGQWPEGVPVTKLWPGNGTRRDRVAPRRAWPRWFTLRGVP